MEKASVGTFSPPTVRSAHIYTCSCFLYRGCLSHRPLFHTRVIPPYYYNKVPHLGSDTPRFDGLHAYFYLFSICPHFLNRFGSVGDWSPCRPILSGSHGVGCKKLHINCQRLLFQFLWPSTFCCTPSPTPSNF